MTGQNIICFAKDWDEQPTSNNHVMRELAKHNRVLWLNSISTRKPSLSSARDVKKIFRKLASFFSGIHRVGEQMWVYTPIVLPFPHSRLATTVNRWILGVSLKFLRARLSMRRDFQLWTFLPNAGEYVGKLGESISVYYCTDEYSKFSYVDGRRTAESERDLCRKADVVFATAHSLVERRRVINPETHLATHGVNHEQFSAAVDGRATVPRDLAALPRPRLGFYGTVQDWVDLDLVRFLAERHPEWTIVLVGDVLVDVSSFAPLKNVHFLGRRPHDALPGYCQGFDVALLPQRVNELTVHMNPIKLREYLSAGLPVVSTPLPEVGHYRHLCTVTDGYEAFEQGVVDALRTPGDREARSRPMAAETWQQKVAALCVHVTRVQRELRTRARRTAAAPPAPPTPSDLSAAVPQPQPPTIDAVGFR